MQASHIDTCLGCYLLDHHNRPGELLLGATVDGNTTQGEVLDELLQELQARCIDDESFDYDAAKACIKSIFCEAFGTILDGKFDASLDVLTDEESDMSEPCQAWFLLTWETESDVA
jgi:hypothetical protein